VIGILNIVKMQEQAIHTAILLLIFLLLPLDNLVLMRRTLLALTGTTHFQSGVVWLDSKHGNYRRRARSDFRPIRKGCKLPGRPGLSAPARNRGVSEPHG
jgi:hypothetical protein